MARVTLSVALVGSAAALLLWFVAVPDPTPAYTVSSPITSGCHERITSEALRTVRLDLPTAGPLPLTRDERALVDDLQFTPDGDMRDLGGATLLLGVRDNDLKGRSSGDLTMVAGVHGDPHTQQEHCLRNAGQDEPGGSLAALTDCRTYIRGRIVEALDGLDANGVPDLTNRTSLPVYQHRDTGAADQGHTPELSAVPLQHRPRVRGRMTSASRMLRSKDRVAGSKHIIKESNP